MTGELHVFTPEQLLLLRVADYFDAGGFCQGAPSKPGGRLCTITAINKLAPSIRIARLAKHILADHLCQMGYYTAQFTNGQVDCDETIVNWHDEVVRRASDASAIIRAAAGVLPADHTPTVILSSVPIR